MRAASVIAIVVLACWVGSTNADEPKIPPPDSDAIAKAQQLIRDIYGTDIDGVKKPADKEKLAADFVENASQITDDEASRFTLLMMARDFAIDANARKEAFDAIMAIADRYQPAPGEPNDTKEQFEKAQQLWRKAEETEKSTSHSQNHEKEKLRLQVQAVEWYARALVGSTGLVKLLCEKRIEEATQEEGATEEKPLLSRPSVVQTGRKAGERTVLTIKGVKYPFRWCPAGTFMMGSPATEEGHRDNETQHRVTFTKGFWIQETLVTQAMWESVMGSNPSNYKGSGKLPVETVNWYACQVYIAELNKMGMAPSGYKFSLPTEAQWEYACRAGTMTPFHFGSGIDRNKANYNHNINKTTEVGSYPANAWGLYDMHGNVWEWCSDWYGSYPSSAATDPIGPSSGSFRLVRGGCSGDVAGWCRSAFRYDSCEPSRQHGGIGLRLALVRK